MARAAREGRSIYRSRKEMMESKETKELLNMPWYRQKRGGVIEREFKETGVRRMYQGMDWEEDSPEPGRKSGRKE